MTSKERVTAVLNFQQPDYMPFHTYFWPEFVDEYKQARGVDPNVRFPCDIRVLVGDETPYMTKAKTLRREGDFEIKRDGWGRTIRVREGAYFMHQIESAYDGGELKYGEFDSPYLAERYERIDEQIEDLKERYYVFAKTGGPFIRTYFMTGEVELLMNMAGDTELAKEQVMRTAHHLADIGCEELRRWDLYDTGAWISDDMASTEGPMFSPKTAEEVLAPAWDYMLRRFKDAGAAKVIIDSDGNIGPLLDLFVDLGFDGIYPVEYKSGLDAVKLREKYGQKLAFIGGLSNGLILPGATREEAREHVLYIMSAGKEGGLVVGTHSVAHDISPDTWDAVWETYTKYRTYPLNLPAI